MFDKNTLLLDLIIHSFKDDGNNGTEKWIISLIYNDLENTAILYFFFKTITDAIK